MGLETVTYISDFVTTNPVGATDPKSQGDDHIRNIKLGVKNTFPNLTGAMTASQAELNILDGATLSTAELNILDGVTLTAAQINDAARKSVENTFTSSIQRITAASAQYRVRNSSGASDSKVGAFASLTDSIRILALNDAEDTVLATPFTYTFSGGVLALAATAITLNGVNLTDLARLSQNNTFTSAAQGISAANGAWSVTDTGVTAAYTANWGGTTSANAWSARTNNTNRLTIDSSGNFDFKAGTVTTNNASASEVGFKGIPYAVKTDNYTLVLTDAGTAINMNAVSKTITIPANASVAFPVGTVITFEGGEATSIAIASDTLFLAGTGYATTGTRTLAQGGIATALKRTSTSWIISGTGLS